MAIYDPPKPTVKLMVEIGMPAPLPTGPRPVQKEEKLPVEDQVREMLECIDSGHDSKLEWATINKLYASLMNEKKKTPRIKNLLKMIEPVLSKYGQHQVSEKE